MKLTGKAARPLIRSAVEQFLHAGGSLYLCERDLKQASLGASDVLPGVNIERGSGGVGAIRNACS
jgi:hypothetical protein